MNLIQNLKFLQKQKADIPWEQEIPNWQLYLEEIREPGLRTLIKIADLASYTIDELLRKDLSLIYHRQVDQKPGLILLDVDGTMSDGGMYYSENGDQLKKFNVKDGLIIYRLIRRQDVQFGLISSGFTGNIMQNRAATLGIERLYHGSRPKVEVIDEWLEEMNLAWKDLAYVGDDLNDLEVIRKAGISACPADAVDMVKASATIVLSRAGGQGCIREFLEDILGYRV